MTEHTAEVQLRERVSSPPAPEFVRAYYQPLVLAGLKEVFEHEMEVHLAHAIMLERCGIVSSADVAKILAAVLALRDSGPSVLTIDYRQEDLYSYVERYLIKQLGPDVGGRLHTGRSRNDLNGATWRMALRARLVELLGTLNAVRTTLIDLAETHVLTVMPGYTHTQHAQPISLGYYFLSFSDLLSRDFERLHAALGHVDVSPLGSGALSTTSFPIDRDLVRDLLGFGRLQQIAYDAVSTRDDVHETVAALAILATGLSRIATDLQSWNTAEFGFVELADSYSAVSSMMPQKKNPHSMEYLKAAAAKVTGALVTVLACSKNTSFADVNDGVSAPNIPALEAADHALSSLEVLNGVLSTLTVHADRMRHAAAVGFGSSTELADVLVRTTGMSFRMAHNIVGRVVREAIAGGRTSADINSGHLDDAAKALFGHTPGVPAEEVIRALDPEMNVRSRTVTGGPAPVRMTEMIEDRRARLSSDKAAVGAVESRIQDARARLLGVVDAVMVAHSSPATAKQVGVPNG